MRMIELTDQYTGRKVYVNRRYITYLTSVSDWTVLVVDGRQICVKEPVEDVLKDINSL